MTSLPILDSQVQDMTDIESAKRTIKTEMDGLSALLGSIDNNFADAVAIIQATKDRPKGRLIVTGMGKSGHIGQKMVATFASTGTPCSFVHPAEASHGDLGMITNDDAIIALSNSGETPELSDILAYAKRFAIPLIAITSNKNSTLGQNANVCLALPKVAEACPIGMAPTTSTTMMIALGDALAIALLERMGMTAEQFKLFHPGGKLGQKLLKVSELLVTGDDLPFVLPSDTMDNVLLVMTEKNLGCALISRDRETIDGIITDGDLKRHMSPDLLSRRADTVMTPDPKTILDTLLAVEALDIMLHRHKQPITSLLVVDKDGRFKGLLRLQSLLSAGVV